MLECGTKSTVNNIIPIVSTEIKIRGMRDILINNSPRMHIPPTRPIPLPLPRKQPSMIPFSNHNSRNTGCPSTQLHHSLLNSRDLQFLDLCKLSLRHTIVEIHDSLRKCICILFIEIDYLGDHAT